MSMNVLRRYGVACAVTGLALTLAWPAMAYTGQKLEKEAKVSIAEARAIALKAHAGKITDEELEREEGGSGLRYSFDIKNGRVDARGRRRCHDRARAGERRGRQKSGLNAR